jgi:hypothetical protein
MSNANSLLLCGSEAGGGIEPGAERVVKWSRLPQLHRLNNDLKLTAN